MRALIIATGTPCLRAVRISSSSNFRSRRPNGLMIERVRVPLGVVAIIYENRPNVTSDAAGICLKSGNAALLRGSSTALGTNRVVADALREGIAFFRYLYARITDYASLKGEGLIEVARFRVWGYRENKWLPPRYAVWLIPAEGQGEINLVDLGEAQRIDEAVQRPLPIANRLARRDQAHHSR